MSFKDQFRADVIEGLSKPIKKLSSKYFYDEVGDKIFQEIMQLDEYYLPEAELDILLNKTEEIVDNFEFDQFDVVELGAGDGSKTVCFLEKLVALGKKISYRPLDISPSVLKSNVDLVNSRIPDLEIHPIAGDYFVTLEKIKSKKPKMILFMGSNIGNYESDSAIAFLSEVKSHMNKGDALLVGIDLKKNPKTILAAYNDKKGVTKRFNLNLLKRINKELDGNFNLDYFDHYPSYDPITGISKSFIVSLVDQVVTIGNESVKFNKGEVLHTEVSQKYDLNQIESMKQQLGFNTVNHYLDSNDYFSISVFK